MTNQGWPPGFTVRPPRLDEAEAVAALICACDVADTGHEDWQVEETRADWARLGFDLGRDARVVVAPDDRIAAYCDVWVRPKAVQIATNSCVHPDFRGLNLQPSLIELAESLAAQHAPLPVRWVLQEKHGRALLERGYRAVRWLWRMQGELDAVPPVPEWPDGFEVRTMLPEDERAAHEVIEDAFERPDRGRVGFDEWRRLIVERDDFDRSLAFLAVHDGEIAATAMCLMFTGEGWVRQLAVKERYRGLGLGRAMLLHAFGEFHHRGAGKVGLGVDAGNPSATHLYSSVGMRALGEYVMYERGSEGGAG